MMQGGEEETAEAGPGSADSGDVPKGVTIASMMQMIKDAEKSEPLRLTYELF